MGQIRDEAERTIALALIAALVVCPLDPKLSQRELLDVAVQSGISPPVFGEAYEEMIRQRRPTDYTVALESMDLVMLWVRGDHTYPDIFPMDAIRRVGEAFHKLQKRHGVKTPQPLEMILSESPDTRDAVELALGFLVVHGNVTRVGDNFVRHSDDEPDYGRSNAAHPVAARLRAMVGVVRNVVAARRNEVVPETPPIQRFHLFLKKQGWIAFASWWAITSREFVALGDQYPTATTVLAGSLLEAALTAISDTARSGGHWRQRFFHEKPPEKWNFSQLIDQAKEAGPFDKADGLMAEKLAELRNRIHAGQFHTQGRGPFTPRSVDHHEAHLAKQQLEHLLKKILDWAPVAALPQA